MDKCLCNHKSRNHVCQFRSRQFPTCCRCICRTLRRSCISCLRIYTFCSHWNLLALSASALWGTVDNSAPGKAYLHNRKSCNRLHQSPSQPSVPASTLGTPRLDRCALRKNMIRSPFHRSSSSTPEQEGTVGKWESGTAFLHNRKCCNRPGQSQSQVFDLASILGMRVLGRSGLRRSMTDIPFHR